MAVYWSMFAIPAVLGVLFGGQNTRSRGLLTLLLAALLVAFAILIGLRWEVGADWFNYQEIVNNISLEPLGTALTTGDPGFSLVAWISTRTGTDQWLPSFVCGAVLIYGLWRFVRRQSDPLLTVTAAVPYLLIVVGMGYVRQAAAIGFILLALIAFERRSWGRLTLWLVLAISVHITAILLIPILGAVAARRRVALLVPLGLLGALSFLLILSPRLDSFQALYVEAQLDSSGALVRLAMNAFPAAIFLLLRRSFPLDDQMRALWTLFALASLALVVIVGLAPSTTIVDRIGLYFIPIQLLVFGNLARALGVARAGEALLTLFIVAYYGTVLFVWLNFATNAQTWLPYRFYPFEG